MDLAKLRSNSRELLANRLPDDKLTQYRTHSDVGEWTMLVTLLCASLVTRNIPITPEERDKLSQLLARFSVTIDELGYISNRAQTLAERTLSNAF